MLTIAHRSWKTDRLDFFSRFLFWIGGCSICLLPPTSCLCFWKQRMPKETISEGRLWYLWGKRPWWREEARQGNYIALTCHGKVLPQYTAECKPCRGLGRGWGKALLFSGCRVLGFHRWWGEHGWGSLSSQCMKLLIAPVALRWIANSQPYLIHSPHFWEGWSRLCIGTLKLSIIPLCLHLGQSAKGK